MYLVLSAFTSSLVSFLATNKASVFFFIVCMLAPNTWCGYKITGLNFVLLPCKLGNSEQCVVLACALPSIHDYNLKVMGQTVSQ